MLRLVFHENKQRRVIDLVPGTYLVGRSEGCDIVIRDSSISGQHLRIDVRDDEHADFRDLMSSNGTFLGKSRKRVDAGPLAPGVILRVGRFVLEIENADPSAAANVPPAPIVPLMDISGDTVAMPAPPPTDAPSTSFGAPAAAQPSAAPIDLNDLPAHTPAAPMVPVVAAPSVETRPAMPSDRSILTLPSGQNQLPPYVPKPPDRRRRRWIAFAVVGFVALVALLLVPSGNRQKTQPPTSKPAATAGFNYEGRLQDGEDAFRRKDYAKAEEIWLALDSEARKNNYTASEAARVYAMVARAFVDLSKGRQQREEWSSLVERLRKLRDDDFYNDRGRTVMMMTKEIGALVGAEKNLRDARAAVERQQYDEAETLLAKISSGSAYANRVNELKAEIADKRRLNRRAEAFRLAQRGQYSEAVDLGGQLLAEDEKDDGLAKELPVWRERVLWESYEKDMKAALDGNDLTAIASALDVIYPRFPQAYIADRNLQTLQTRLTQKRAELEIVQLFNAWNDLPRLEKLIGDQETANNPRVTAYANAFRRVKKALADYDAAKQAEDYSAMQAAAREVLAIDLLPEDHPARRTAQALVKPEKEVAKLWLDSAQEAWQRHRYADTRRRMHEARRILGADIENNDTYVQLRKANLQAAREFLNARGVGDFASSLIKARDCTVFPDGDEETQRLYNTIIATYRRRIGGDIPPVKDERGKEIKDDGGPAADNKDKDAGDAE